MKHLIKGMIASTVLATIVSGHAIADDPVRGGTLITVLGSNPRTLNGAVQSGIVTGYPTAQLFASPLRYDEDWTPQPYLAESWEISDDGLTVTLNLVKNAVFHDGQPVTSADIAFSVEVIKANHPFKQGESVLEVICQMGQGRNERSGHPPPALLEMSRVDCRSGACCGSVGGHR